MSALEHSTPMSCHEEDKIKSLCCYVCQDLLGPDVIQGKREAENEPNFQPLSPTAKAKHPKKGQFTLKRKKSKAEMDFEDMVCPFSAG